MAKRRKRVELKEEEGRDKGREKVLRKRRVG